MSDTIVSIGTFDGVHLGHARLMRVARELAGPEGRVIALSFDPHPLSLLRPGDEPPRLTTISQRADLLNSLGVDEVHRLEPDRELLSFSPRRFMEQVQASFGPASLVEGEDFHFGKGRSGNVMVLRGIARDLGFDVEVVPDVDVALGDHTIHKASSSLVRRLIALGRVRDAAAALGRPYALTGKVFRGDRRGRSIGFPTANMLPEQLAPADGVYAGWAVLPGGTRRPAAINVGLRPTVGGAERRVEAHVLGLETSWTAQRGFGDGAAGWRTLEGLPEYGWPLTLEMVSWVRDEMRFGGLGELTAQIARDCGRVLERIDAPYGVPAEAL